jgi:hypothetical protein
MHYNNLSPRQQLKTTAGGNFQASKGLSNSSAPNKRSDSFALQFYNRFMKKDEDDDLDEGIENIVDVDNTNEFPSNDINAINVSFQKMRDSRMPLVNR